MTSDEWDQWDQKLESMRANLRRAVEGPTAGNRRPVSNPQDKICAPVERPEPRQRKRNKSQRESPCCESRQKGPRVESYAEWMARIDDQVEAEFQKVTKRPPLYRWLSTSQRGIVEMLVEYLRTLPELASGEDAFEKASYVPAKLILTRIFQAKYPEWKARRDGIFYIDDIPNGGDRVYTRLLKGCGGRIPVEPVQSAAEEDDD